MNFDELNLKDFLKINLRNAGFNQMFEIQEKSIPLAARGNHILAQSKTGSGKTLAFAIPILQKVDENSRHIQAIILTPTRELAQQVEDVFRKMTAKTRIRSVCIYGGASISRQAEILRSGVQIVVGTPGRVLDQIERGNLLLRSVQVVVLDEADRMLEMGFIEDVEQIIGETPSTRQMLLFSATIPREIQHIINKYMKNYENLDISRDTLTVDGIKQYYIEADKNGKISVLVNLLKEKQDLGQVLVFCRTKRTTDWLSEKLRVFRINALPIHGDLSQSRRNKVIQLMHAGKIKVLVATDVAARGLDIKDVGLVVNFDIPDEPNAYVHRIGRTARAGRTGQAISILSPIDHANFRAILNTLKVEVEPIATEMNTFYRYKEEAKRAAPRFHRMRRR